MINNLPPEDCKQVRCPQCGNVETVEISEDVECPLCKIGMEEEG